MQYFSRHFLTAISLLFALLMANAEVFAEPLAERDFLRQVMGQSQAKVRGVMGEPDSVRIEGKYEYWIYHDVVRDMISRETFRQTQVLFVDDRVADSIHSNAEPEE